MPANHCMPHTEKAKAKMSASHKGKPLPHKRRPMRVVDGVEFWRCGTCRGYFPREGFYKNKRTLLGITTECRKCHSKTSIRTRNIENTRRLGRESMSRQRLINPEKVRAKERQRGRNRLWDEKREARYKLNLAIRRGDVVKPANCQECGEIRKLSGHHHDYSKPFDVKWLCSECHGRQHRKVVEFKQVEVSR